MPLQLPWTLYKTIMFRLMMAPRDVRLAHQALAEGKKSKLESTKTGSNKCGPLTAEERGLVTSIIKEQHNDHQRDVLEHLLARDRAAETRAKGEKLVSSARAQALRAQLDAALQSNAFAKARSAALEKEVAEMNEMSPDVRRRVGLKIAALFEDEETVELPSKSKGQEREGAKKKEV